MKRMRILQAVWALGLAGLLAGLLAGSAEAQVRLFFDTSATAPTESTTNQSNPVLNLLEGDNATLYLWAQMPAGQEFNGLGLNIDSSSPIVSGSYTWDNPNALGSPRWAEANGGAPEPDSWIVYDANAVKVGGSNLGKFLNLGPGPFTDDPFYNAATNSWRVGQLDLQTLAAGTTELRLGVGLDAIGFQVGGPNVLFGWGDSAVSGGTISALSSLADATINVAAVPEPATFGLFTLAGVALLRFRRRRR